MNKWKPTYRQKPVNPNNLCGIELRWLKGEGENDNYKHEAFINPIKLNSENMWKKYWMNLKLKMELMLFLQLLKA